MRGLRYLVLSLLAFATVAQAQTVTQKENTSPYQAATTTVATDGTGRTLSVPVVSVLSAAPGASTSGQSGTLVQCAVVTGNQSYVAGTTQPCNLTPTGRLKVGVSAATNIAPGANLTTTLDSDLVGCMYRAIPPAWSDGWTGAVGCDASGRVAVAPGSGNIATAQTSVGTSATLVVAARPGRQKVTFSVGAANICAFGASGVTTTTGFPLQPTAGASLTLDSSAAIYAVCSASTTISDIEQF